MERPLVASRNADPRPDLKRKMVELPSVTLVAVDTVNHALALRALRHSQRQARFVRTLFLSNALPEDESLRDHESLLPSIEFVPIEPLASRDAYSSFVLKRLLDFVSTSHVLLIQWDGYVVNGDAWQPAFLECDYIGAKWFWQPQGRRVGNGGFSLRSRRLLEALRDPRIVLSGNEDLTICDTFRPLLESEHAIRFADESLAERFAFEAAWPIGRPFGFHGLFNFARVVPPAELAALAARFSDAIAASPQAAQLLRNCVALGQWQVAIAMAQRRLQALPADAETTAILQQAELAAPVAPAAGRNDPCPCGSGKRYKQCHGAIAATATASPDERVKTGMVAHRRGDLEAAARDYEAALAQAPDHPYALHYRGMIDYQRGQPAAALERLQRAVALRPEEAEFHNNLGLVLVDLDRHDAAIAAYRGALALNAQNAGAWSNLGLALTADNRLAESIDAFRRAIALRADYGEAHWNLALALLAHGEFAEGWREYEWRLAMAPFADRTFVPNAPRWNGENPTGKTLLLIAEQGLGDTLQFVRFARPLAERGARVVVRAPPALAHLLASVPGVAATIAPDDASTSYDWYSPMISLPGLLGVDASNIPADVPYLAALPSRLERMAAEVALHAPHGRRIGIAWSGARHHTNDRRRSCPLGALVPLFDVPGTAWFSLQKSDVEDEIADVPAARNLIRLEARNDLDGTAALVAALDLVISVDTSLGHLSAALARPTWVMLPFAPDWRWGTTGTSSRWYPSLRLFRQPRRGDWPSVVRAVAGALAPWVGSR